MRPGPQRLLCRFKFDRDGRWPCCVFAVETVCSDSDAPQMLQALEGPSRSDSVTGAIAIIILRIVMLRADNCRFDEQLEYLRDA